MAMIRFQIPGRRRPSSQRGYMLLVMMLAVAVLVITMAGVAQSYRRSIQRDREVEMIHRGEQYARAIRRFYRKYNRYPTSVEQLENTNDLRFLRKRYKDPMSPDGTWRLLHESDIRRSPGGTITLAQNGSLNGNAISSMNDAAQDSQSNPFGSSANGIGSSTTSSDTDGAAATGAFGSNALGSNPSGSNSLGGAQTANGNAASPGNVLGGGSLLGVVSKTKVTGIHSFGGKSRYDEWFFLYDPSQDTGQGRLPTGPYNPKAFMNSVSSGLGGTTGTNQGTSTSGSTTGSTGSAFGNSGGSSSGTSSGSSNTTPTTTP